MKTRAAPIKETTIADATLLSPGAWYVVDGVPIKSNWDGNTTVADLKRINGSATVTTCDVAGRGLE